MVGQLFASRTAIRILVAEIDKVLFAKATPCLNTDVIGLEASPQFQPCRRQGGKDFLATIVAAISNGFEFFDAEDTLCTRGDVGELCPVRADVRHLMRDDQVMLGVDRDLHEKPLEARLPAGITSRPRGWATA